MPDHLILEEAVLVFRRSRAARARRAVIARHAGQRGPGRQIDGLALVVGVRGGQGLVGRVLRVGGGRVRQRVGVGEGGGRGGGELARVLPAEHAGGAVVGAGVGGRG